MPVQLTSRVMNAPDGMKASHILKTGPLIPVLNAAQATPMPVLKTGAAGTILKTPGTAPIARAPVFFLKSGPATPILKLSGTPPTVIKNGTTTSSLSQKEKALNVAAPLLNASLSTHPMQNVKPPASNTLKTGPVIFNGQKKKTTPSQIVKSPSTLTVKSAPTPIVKSVPAPIVKSVPAPIVKSVPAPIVKSIPAPIVKSIPAPIVKSIPAPIVKSAPTLSVKSVPPPASTPILKTQKTPNLDQSQKRRSSSRSIKRKRFDDELVESSLVKTRIRPPAGALPVKPSGVTLSSLNGPKAAVVTNNQVVQNDSVTSLSSEKRKSRPPAKRVKKLKGSFAQLPKNIGRWKPSDDLALILSVQQTNDLEAVFRSVKFSCYLSLDDIKQRWYALLYKNVLSKAAFSAIRQMHPDDIAQVQAKVSFFSKAEESLLASVHSSFFLNTDIAALHQNSDLLAKGSLEVLQQLLESNSNVFLPSRTAKALHAHWTLMKQYNLLSDQICRVHKAPPGDSILSFSDAAQIMNHSKLILEKDEDLETELASTDRLVKREIKQIENELQKWQVVVDSITGTNNEEFNANTLAVLKGRIVRYLMQSREITFGRAAKDSNVDIDLSLEGPASKISRRQGFIKMENNGDFFLMNEGKRPIYVDGRPVLIGSKIKLGNNSVVEVVGLRFIFLVNHDYVMGLRNKN